MHEGGFFPRFILKWDSLENIIDDLKMYMSVEMDVFLYGVRRILCIYWKSWLGNITMHFWSLVLLETQLGRIIEKYKS